MHILRLVIFYLVIHFNSFCTLAQSAADVPEKPTGKKYALKYFSLAFTNNHSAFPFASFSKLVTGGWHPGFEAGTGFHWSEKKKHDWFQDFRIGYFYHQFVQHGIPIYTTFGYRYKFSPRWNAQAGIGAGYFHSIPDHQRFEMNGEGDYEELGGIGRGQAMLVFNLSAGYKFNLAKKHPLEIFMTYQQRMQTPYVPNYVPLLPYNSLMLGVRREIPNKQIPNSKKWKLQMNKFQIPNPKPTPKS